MTDCNNDDETMFKRVKSALATLDAAFPAGDYHLNKRQNNALNTLLDISFELRQKDPLYSKEVHAARDKANAERMAVIMDEIRKRKNS